MSGDKIPRKIIQILFISSKNINIVGKVSEMD